MNPYFSIITPVYNQRTLLTPCMESLLRQTFEDFEVLIVDDGSTDGSVDLIRSLVREDPRFRILRHACNRSVLEARITGLSAAGGRYVCSVDIDDYIDDDMLELLHDRLESEPLDLLTIQIKADGKGLICDPPHADDYLSALLEGKTRASMIQYVFSSESVKKALPFIRHGYCNLGEDLYLSSLLMFFSTSFGNLKCAPYHYTLGAGMSSSLASITFEKVRQQYEHLQLVFSCLQDFFAENGPDYLPLLQKARFDNLMSVAWKTVVLPWDELFDAALLFRDRDFDVFLHCCTDIIPARANHANEKKEGK